jgi:hypothetical protein
MLYHLHIRLGANQGLTILPASIADPVDFFWPDPDSNFFSEPSESGSGSELRSGFLFPGPDSYLSEVFSEQLLNFIWKKYAKKVYSQTKSLIKKKNLRI